MSNKTSYTPGPWEVRREFNVFCGNRSIAACGGYSSNVEKEQEKVVAENIANARLIAAAPGLLKSCIDAANFLTYLVSHDSNYREVGELLVQLDRAICAATGSEMPYDVKET